MTWLKKAVIVFAVLCIEVEMRSRSKVELTKEWTFRRNQTVIVAPPYPDLRAYSKFYYMICENASYVSKSEKNCNITAEWRNIADTEQQQSCNYNLQSADGYMIKEDSIKIQGIGFDKVIVFYLNLHENLTEKPNLKIGILNLANCESIKSEIILKTNEYEYHVIPYEEMLDVVLKNDPQCKSTWCKVTYDSFGNQIGNLVEMLPNINIPENTRPDFYRIDYQSPWKGYFVFFDNVDDDKFQFFTVRPNGTVRETLNMTKKNPSFHNYRKSSEHEYITICLFNLRSTITNCTQLDENLKVKVNKTLDRSEDPNELLSKVYNLPSGGFLLWTTGEQSSRDSGKSHIYKVHGNGHYERMHIGFYGLDCDIEYPSSHKIYETENDYCFVNLCQRDSKRNDKLEQKVTNKCVQKYMIQ